MLDDTEDYEERFSQMKERYCFSIIFKTWTAMIFPNPSVLRSSHLYSVKTGVVCYDVYLWSCSIFLCSVIPACTHSRKTTTDHECITLSQSFNVALFTTPGKVAEVWEFVITTWGCQGYLKTRYRHEQRRCRKKVQALYTFGCDFRSLYVADHQSMTNWTRGMAIL